MLTIAHKTRTNRIRYVLFALGVAMIGVAWIVRQTVLAANARSIPFAVAAARNARNTKLQAEAAVLEERATATPNELALDQKLLILSPQTGQPQKEIAQLSKIVRLTPDDQAAFLAL